MADTQGSVHHFDEKKSKLSPIGMIAQAVWPTFWMIIPMGEKSYRKRYMKI